MPEFVERPLPAGARLIGSLSPNEKLSVSMILRRRPDGPAVPDAQYWMANPPGHRPFLSPEQFEQAYGAAPADIDAVVQWANANGLMVTEQRAGRRTVIVNGTAEQLNKALDIRLNQYESPLSGRRDAGQAATQVHRGFEGMVRIPSALTGIVTDLIGLDNRQMGGRCGGDPPNTNPLPTSQIAQLYQFPNTGAVGQVVGVFNGNGGLKNYNPADLMQCISNQPPGYKQEPMLIEVDLTVDGGTITNAPLGPLDVEITQDIQIVAVIAQGATINVYCSTSTEDGWLAFLNRVIMPEPGDKVPSVLTSSWFLGQDSDLTMSLLNTLSAKFADLTTLGVTVFIAEGDSGSAGYENDGKCHVVYPGSDPSVTSCGGTTIGNVSGSSFDEIVWNDSSGATGGGVSDVFPVPTWQTAAGLAPLSKNDNQVRRGVPDVAANASGNSGCSDLVMGGMPLVGSGTSAVAPLYAGLTAVLIQALGQPIGFLNPTLYVLGESVFRDITSGNNNLANVAPYYTAGPGWDACTGWGSINGAALLSALQTLYARNFYFIVDKSTFGVDELTASLVYKNAFWLVLEGFTIDQVGGAVPSFSGPFDGFGGLTISMDALGIAYEFPGDNYTPQRIRFPYDVTFVSGSAAAFPMPGQSANELLTANIMVQGMMLAANTIFEVEGGADPYFMNIGTTDNDYYLSQDLRVFTITPEMDGVMPVGSVPFTFTSGGPSTMDTAAAYNYIQQMIGFLNTTYGDPGNADPFNTLLPDQLYAETGDSSVTPLTSDPGSNPFINYNFAVARVRMNGNGSMAPNTKVFFRLFNTQTFDTDYVNTSAYVSAGDPNITYPSTGSADDPALPLPGTDGNSVINGCSLPFFAAADQTDLSPGGVNNQNISVSSADGVWTYFGCYLDVYNPSLMIGGFPVQHWLAGGTHHCLVAQIAYSGAPIVNADGVIENPGNCDKLAQRNLQISPAGTVGPPGMRRIPMTFDTRPSPVLRPAAYLTGLPDELMIDWGNLPAESVVSIYWPQVSAAAVVELAMKRNAYPFLTATDAHTIRCLSHKGVTYIPIPGGVGGESFAGLLTVDLPERLREERGYQVTVRRVTSRRPALAAAGIAGVATVGTPDTAWPRVLNWRYVVGIFQVNIPLMNPARLLPQEENLLAVLAWRHRLLPERNKWHPVLTRYIAEVSARVSALREGCVVEGTTIVMLEK